MLTRDLAHFVAETRSTDIPQDAFGWHATATAGAFASAAACGRLLGLNAEQIMNALRHRRNAVRRAAAQLRQHVKTAAGRTGGEHRRHRGDCASRIFSEAQSQEVFELTQNARKLTDIRQLTAKLAAPQPVRHYAIAR